MLWAITLAGAILLPMQVSFDPCCDVSQVRIDTVEVEDLEFHMISIEGFGSSGYLVIGPGTPSLPCRSSTFLLPPDNEVTSVSITDQVWKPIPGKYLPYPRQSGLTGDTSFVQPSGDVYGSSLYFPETPVQVARQGSAMGYSVATLTGTPLRYSPSDSTLQVLTSCSISLNTRHSSFERIHPHTETLFSSKMRMRGILGLVSNPDLLSLYGAPSTFDYSSRTGPVTVSQAPASGDNGVDLLIITGEELESAFTDVAEYRTMQGIVSQVRTVEWIQQNYSGCDTPERIRNLIRDAHEYWGIQAVIIGGDDDIVPVRQCNGWAYNAYPYPTYQMPSDDYYGDIDGDWSATGGIWSTNYQNGYLDLCVGRWPVDDVSDVEAMLQKLRNYEMPAEMPEDFARRLMLMGSNDVCGSGADDMILLKSMLENSGAIPEYLDEPAELYFPHSLPAGDLCRINALEEFDTGYNLILHADHSETHKLATAGRNTLGQYMWDSDFATMANSGRSSILWTLGCGPGHFDGADCFAEAGLIFSSASGLSAVIANARYGLFDQKVTYYVFCDALFNTGYCSSQFGISNPDWPLSYLGEAHRTSKNVDGISYVLLNFLGSPLMSVWRDDPMTIDLSVPIDSITAGVETDIPVTVTSGGNPLAGASVCIWARDEIFSIDTTDELGRVTFNDVMIQGSQGGSSIAITALKRRTQITGDSSTVASYLPAQRYLNVLPAQGPLVVLDSYSVIDQGDGQANPGESVQILLRAGNTGTLPASRISAELMVIEGWEYLASFPDQKVTFPDIDPGSSSDADLPFRIRIRSDVPSYSEIGFMAEIECESDGQVLNWCWPLEIVVASEDYRLTSLNPLVDTSQNASVTITIDDMVLANSGLGEGRNLMVTVDSIFPAEPFYCNTIELPQMSPGSSIDLRDMLTVEIHPQHLNSLWAREDLERCSLNVSVLSQGVRTVARRIDAGLVLLLQETDIQPPSEAQVYENSQNSISLCWDHDGFPYAEAFYVYVDDGHSVTRTSPLPLPARQVTAENLQPGSEYSFLITALDTLGRESEAHSITAATTMAAMEGWPVQLEGSTGGGPLIVDVDGDGLDEIVAVTTFGRVYLIDSEGESQELSPPQGCDFDRFLGSAAGDVDADGQTEIVVSCQKMFEVEGEERISLILYDRTGNRWTAQEIAETLTDQQVASPMVAGTPVLLQADLGRSMEIALRTKGHYGSPPRLYLWKLDPNTGTWSNYNDDFPIDLTGYFYSAPIVLDFDGDMRDELLVSLAGTGVSGSAILMVDVLENEVSTQTRYLTELDAAGRMAKTLGTMCATQHDDTCYIAGVASTIDSNSDEKQLFCYSVAGDSTEMVFEWSTGWVPCTDFYGNIPGPSLGDVDGDSDLDLIYVLNCGVFGMEGMLVAWDLLTGDPVYSSDPIPFNPIMEDGGRFVRSQPVSVPMGRQASGFQVFSTFSSLLCCHDPSAGTGMISGFPAWSRDAGWSSPAVCDLDDDGLVELLYVDCSGRATLYELDLVSELESGWRMFQCNEFRNGFLAYPEIENFDLDIAVTSVSLSSDTDDPDAIAEISVVIRITGPANSYTDGNFPPSRGSDGSAETLAPSHSNEGTVPVNAYSGGELIGSTNLRLAEGDHHLRIPLVAQLQEEAGLTVVADPDNMVNESNESNNVSTTGGIRNELVSVHIPSPAPFLSLTVDNASGDVLGLVVRLYSLDGRLQLEDSVTDVTPGRSVHVIGDESLPSGLFLVSIDGLPQGESLRTVVIIGE